MQHHTHAGFVQVEYVPERPALLFVCVMIRHRAGSKWFAFRTLTRRPLPLLAPRFGGNTGDTHNHTAHQDELRWEIYAQAWGEEHAPPDVLRAAPVLGSNWNCRMQV